MCHTALQWAELSPLPAPACTAEPGLSCVIGADHVGALDITEPEQHVLERVAGQDASYHCPDIKAVERHIVAVRARIAKAGDHAPLTVTRLHADVDLLLDRLSYLHHMALPA